MNKPNKSTASKLAKINSATSIINYAMTQHIHTMHTIEMLVGSLKKAKEEGKTDMDYDFMIKAQQDGIDRSSKMVDKTISKLHDICEEVLNYMDGSDSLNEDDCDIINPPLELLQDKRNLDL